MRPKVATVTQLVLCARDQIRQSCIMGPEKMVTQKEKEGKRSLKFLLPLFPYVRPACLVVKMLSQGELDYNAGCKKAQSAALSSEPTLCSCALTIVCVWHLRLAGMLRPPSITLFSSTQRAELLSILVPSPHSTLSLIPQSPWVKC